MNPKARFTISIIVDDYDTAIEWYCDVLSLFVRDGNMALRKQLGNVVLRYYDEAYPVDLQLRIAKTVVERILRHNRFGEILYLSIPVVDCLHVVGNVRSKGGKLIGDVVETPYAILATVEDPFGNHIALAQWF